MKISSLSVGILPILYATVACATDVHVGTGSNWEKTLKEATGPILAKFYAPWCGHCKALAPKFEEAATELKDENVTLVKVDCTVENDLCSKYGVQGYPTLKVFHPGTAEPANYGGNRETQGIVEYMKKQTLDPVTQLESVSEIEAFKTKDKAVTVAILEWSDASNRAVIDQIAALYRDTLVLGIAPDTEEIKSHFKIEKTPAMFVLKTFDDGREDFTGEWSYDALADFIMTASHPLVDQITPDNFARIASAGKPIGYVFIPSDDSNLEKVTGSLSSIAKKLRDKLSLVWIDANVFGDHAKTLGLTEPKWPSFAIQNIDKQTKFPYGQDNAFTPELLEAFISEVLAGNVDPTIRSAPIPESQDEDVFVLVAAEFEKVAQDKSKNVLVEFYAPWCGHCKKLKPTYDELAANFKKHSDVVIAKFDGTENDFPPVEVIEVQGFPTLFFRPKNADKWVMYTGDRSLDDLTKFVNTHSVLSEGHDEL